MVKKAVKCSEVCCVWDRYDKDCDVYGSIHPTPRTCKCGKNFSEKMKKWGENRIIDAEFEELEPEQEKKPAKKDKKWIREIFNFCACMLAALLFSRILGIFIYGE